jgi:hypothetical protein
MSHQYLATLLVLETGSPYAAQAGLELLILLPLPLECSDYGVHHHAWLSDTFEG